MPLFFRSWASGLAAIAFYGIVATPATAELPARIQTQKAEVAVETVATGLEHPWALTFLPDGGMLVTERPGWMRIVGWDGVLSQPLNGVPSVMASGQGGLLDVALDPKFTQNRLVYFSYAEQRQGGNGTSVARARLSDDGRSLEQLTVIFRQEPAYNGKMHFGSRLVFDRAGMLFVTLGERFDLRDEAQNPSNTLGKIVRIRPEGGAAPGNPYLNKAGTQPEIWSIGHRNVQGAALNPETGELWTAEHGARGGDEINIPRKGRNYGWPVISYGVNYTFTTIGEGTAKAGMEQPLHYWDPSIAPSGMVFYTGRAFPAWRGDIFVGALAGSMVVRLSVAGDKVVAEERILTDTGERFRDIRQGPDGFLYVLTDSPKGQLLRLRPAGS